MDAEVDIEFNLRTEAINEAHRQRHGHAGWPRRHTATRRANDGDARANQWRARDCAARRRAARKRFAQILRILRSLSPEADESAVRHFEQWRFSPRCEMVSR